MRSALALAAMLLATQAAAEPERERIRDWQVLRAAEGCVATTSVGLRAAGTGLVTLALLPRPRAAGGAPAVMTVRVPLGAHLASGIAYTHPGETEAVGLAWQSCDAETCLASGGIGPEELGRLQRGRRILLGFRPLPSSRPLVVPVSLMGVTRAWAAVQDCARPR
jgi:invasion protein IalB